MLSLQPDRAPSPVALSSNSALKTTKCQKQLQTRAILVLVAIAVAWSPALAQSVSLSPTSVSFGSPVVGTTSASQAVTLSNPGSASLSITSIAASTQFGQTNNCPISPSTLPVNGACTIDVTFTPTAAGTQSGSITIIDSAVGSPQQISLTGTGTSFTPIRVHAGGSAYTDSLHNVWSADTGFSGGNTYTTTGAIANTTDPTLYLSERYGAMTYTFTVPAGTYNVTLKFAEIFYTNPGERIFNVAINGTTVLPNFDIVAQAGGGMKALDKTFPATAVAGKITIQFTTGSVDLPKISAIQIAP